MFSQHLLNGPLISLLVVAAVSISGVALLSVLPLDTARPGDKTCVGETILYTQDGKYLPATPEGRLQAEVDVLLGVEANNEGGDVDDLQHEAREGGTWLGEVTWSVCYPACGPGTRHVWPACHSS